MRADATVPSDAALAKIDSFMKNGGTIFFDLRNDGAGVDALTAARRCLGGPAPHAGKAGHSAARAGSRGPCADPHLLSHAGVSGRYNEGQLWVEQMDAQGSNSGAIDGVSSIIIGSNDYAAAWALDDRGEPLYAVIPGLTASASSPSAPGQHRDVRADRQLQGGSGHIPHCWKGLVSNGLDRLLRTCPGLAADRGAGGDRPRPDGSIGLCAGPRWPLRSLALALLLLALANPSIRNEQREALSDIAVAVIDRSLSQQGGNRPGQTDEAEAALRSAVQRLGNTELRVVDVRSGVSASDDGTLAFEALSRALSDIPPERFAGAIMVTDGQVHDAPAEASASGLSAPLHGLLNRIAQRA